MALPYASWITEERDMSDGFIIGTGLWLTVLVMLVAFGVWESRNGGPLV